jgi:hypothetical protein
MLIDLADRSGRHGRISESNMEDEYLDEDNESNRLAFDGVSTGSDDILGMPLQASLGQSHQTNVVRLSFVGRIRPAQSPAQPGPWVTHGRVVTSMTRPMGLT